MYLTTIVRAMHDCDEDTEMIVFDNLHASLSELNMPPRVRVTSLPFIPRNRVGRVLYQNTVYPLLMRYSGADALLATCNVVPFGVSMPTVLVIQSLQYFEPLAAYGAVRRHYLRVALTNSVRRASAVICVSHASKEELVKLTGIERRKVHVVYHGLPPSHLAGKQPANRPPSTQPYILYVSSLYAYKNVFRVLDAYAMLRRGEGIRQRLRIIGPEADYTVEDVRRRAIGLGVGEHVDVLGAVDHTELPEHYAGADLFIYPSLYETFGLPPLEAMAAGCPVVAANSSSIPEVVGDAAELVDPLDVGMIATGMHKVLTDDARRNELVKRGQARAAEFTWERAGRQTLELLKQAAER